MLIYPAAIYIYEGKKRRITHDGDDIIIIVFLKVILLICGKSINLLRKLMNIHVEFE